MRIDYISDLHVDYYISEKENQENFISKFEKIDFILFKNEKTYGDILIIAGDLSESLNQIKWFFCFIKKDIKKYYIRMETIVCIQMEQKHLEIN